MPEGRFGPKRQNPSPARGIPMKITVNFDMCQSNALCMSVAPEVFEVRDDGFLYILNENPGEELRAKMDEAVRLCPTQAITVE